MTNAWRVSDPSPFRRFAAPSLSHRGRGKVSMPDNPSPPVGEGGAREAKPRGRVRGESKRAQLPHWTTERSRELRRNATEAEKKLWRALRESFPDAKFRRQQPLGPYFADFCSHSAKLVIELDGGQHATQTAHDTAAPASWKAKAIASSASGTTR